MSFVTGRRDGRCSVDGEEAAEDALHEPCAQHDHIVLLIHGGGEMVAVVPGEREASARRAER